jgi:hypothetical protein
LRVWRRPWRGVIIALTVIFIAGIVVAAVFNEISANKDDIWSTISKAGVAIAATTVAGAVATGALKLVDEWRVRDQERRRVFHDVVETYNEVKSIRRNLRALGLLIPRSDPLTAEEAKDVLSIMTRLNDAQLRFEAIKREVEQSNLFNHPDLVISELRTVENYINKSVIGKWEESQGRIREGAAHGELDNLRQRLLEPVPRQVRVFIQGARQECPELGQVGLQRAGHGLGFRVPGGNLLLPHLPLFLPGFLPRICRRRLGVLLCPCQLSPGLQALVLRLGLLPIAYGTGDEPSHSIRLLALSPGHSPHPDPRLAAYLIHSAITGWTARPHAPHSSSSGPISPRS